MIIDIYVNKAKDPDKSWLNKFMLVAETHGIEYRIIDDDDLKSESQSDALFVIGGDGTILNLTEYASKNNLPIVGFNAGKLGFLTEFELSDIEQAFLLFKNGQLKPDCRATILMYVNKTKFYALNDAVIQRIRIEERGNNVTNLDVYIDDILVDKIIGDGVCISTPTGSTAYSFSAGGAILAPGISAFSITDIAGHSFNQRPIVYSADSICTVKVNGNCKTGLFIDGIFACEVFPEDELTISTSSSPVMFLRKEGFNFYKRLYDKLKNRSGI